MRQKKHCYVVGIGLLLLCLCIMPLAGIEKADERIRIMFTHDMHDAMTPTRVRTEKGVEEIGGFSRLMSAISKEKETDMPTLVVDAGDYSMGTLFQSLYEDIAPELYMLGKMGYEVVTFGNHEFDFRATGLANHLKEVVEKGGVLPELVIANMEVPEASSELQEALDVYGAKDYTIVEKDGLKIGVFGLMGKEATSNAPMAGVTFTDPIAEAKRVVGALKAEGADLIVCLSHSGTHVEERQSEDELLARKVPEIDVIISGHSHTTLTAPKVVGNTIIGSSGSNAAYLGTMDLVKNGEDRWELVDYRLVAIDETLPENEMINNSVAYYKKCVEESYLNHFGLTFDQVVAHTTYDFVPRTQLGKAHKEEPLGNLLADGFRYAVQQAEGDAYEPIAVTIVPAGTIRSSFVKGDITVEQLFAVSSLGIGKDNLAGYPLIEVYLTGKEIKDACEVDASITPLMSAAQLYFSGLEYSFHTKRIPFNKVMDVALVTEDGTREVLEDEKLYRVVGSLYTAQTLSIVKDKSLGLLSVVPKTKDGEVITNLEDHILYTTVDGKPTEIKEWIALATYLQSFDAVNGVPRMLARYKETEGRKIVVSEWCMEMFTKNIGVVTWVVYGVIGIVIIGVGILLLRRGRRSGGGGRNLRKGIVIRDKQAFRLYR